jgi:large subunit ribosomal protein L25
MIRDYQIDPLKDVLVHCDFKRIKMDEAIQTTIPIHYSGKCKGVIDQAGMLEIVMRELEIECLPDDIPDEVSLDITQLLLGEGIRIKNLSLGDKIKILGEEDQLILHVVAPKKVVLESEVPAEGEEGAEEGVKPEEGAEEEVKDKKEKKDKDRKDKR